MRARVYVLLAASATARLRDRLVPAPQPPGEQRERRPPERAAGHVRGVRPLRLPDVAHRRVHVGDAERAWRGRAPFATAWLLEITRS